MKRRTHAFARRASGCGFAALLLLAAGATRCESTDPGCNDLNCATRFARGEDADPGGGARAAPAPTVASVSKPGPHKVAKLGESDGLRNGPGYKGATVYFPRDGQPPYGSVVIVPGYVSPERSIKAWGPFYASHGIVAMTIGTNSSRDRPKARSLALLDAITSLRAENKRAGSPLRGRLDVTRFAVSGWSMGGGGAQLAAVGMPQLKAVVALCPWKPNAKFSHSVPVLIFGGSKDNLAPVSKNASPHYKNTPHNTPKLLFEVRGAGHWIANDPQGANGAVGRFGLCWLKVFLDDDPRYRQFLLVKPPTASQFLNNLARPKAATGAVFRVGPPSSLGRFDFGRGPVGPRDSPSPAPVSGYRPAALTALRR